MNAYKVSLDPQTLFILSTSGSPTSIEKHNQALQSLSLNFAYFTFGRPINAETYAGLLRAPIVKGGAVTGQGLKSGIIDFLDEIDDLAKITGAVNTVINEDGKLHGFNTDAFGFETAVRQHIQSAGLNIKTAVIYGNGGVSGVAAHVLKSLGIRTTMTGRNPEKVATKMDQLQLDRFEGPYDLVINATPASSENIENARRLLGTLKGCQAVFDHNMPEKDGKTNYLREYCNTNGLYFMPGKDMYVAQMIKQWKLFLEISEDEIKTHWDL